MCLSVLSPKPGALAGQGFSQWSIRMSVRIASPPFWGPLWCLGPPRTIAGHLGLANPPSGTPRASTDFNSKSIGILEAFIKIYRDLKISFRFPARGGFTNPRSSVSRTEKHISIPFLSLVIFSTKQVTEPPIQTIFWGSNAGTWGYMWAEGGALGRRLEI